MTLTAQAAADAEDRAADDPPVVIRRLAFELGRSMGAEFADRETSGLVTPPRRLHAVAYDTADGLLAQHGITLDVQDDGDGPIHTVDCRPVAAGRCADADDGPFDHLQWQRPVLHSTPSIDALPPASDPIGALLRDCFDRLVPVAETEVDRRARIVVLEGDARLEIASVTGQQRTGDAMLPIALVEVTQLAGAPAAFQRYVLQWARLHRAVLCISQPYSSRPPTAQAMAGPAARFAPPAVATADSGTAARAVVGACLAALAPLLGRVRLLDDEEGPRALGIVLQRLRGALTFFELIEDPAVATDLPWRAADRLAARLQAANAAVREADRLEEGLLQRLAEALPGDRALAALADALRSARAARRQRLKAVLDSSVPTELVLLMAAALAEPTVTAPAPTGFPDFASRRLAALGRCCETLASAGRTPNDRATLRTALRRLRHGVETSTAALPDGHASRRLVTSLGDAQRRLGLEQERLADRRTAPTVMACAGADAVDAARALALIDGFHRFGERDLGREDPAETSPPRVGLPGSPTGRSSDSLAGRSAVGPSGNSRGRRAAGRPDPGPGDELAALAMLRAWLKRARPSPASPSS